MGGLLIRRPHYFYVTFPRLSCIGLQGLQGLGLLRHRRGLVNPDEENIAAEDTTVSASNARAFLNIGLVDQKGPSTQLLGVGLPKAILSPRALHLDNLEV